MRVLIVTQFFYPESFRINDLTAELKRRGHEVVVLTGLPNYPKGEIFSGYHWWRSRRDTYAGVPVLRVPVIPRAKGGAKRLMMNYGSFVASASTVGLARLFGRRFDACLVFATSPITAALPACFYRAFTGCPLAIWIQDLWPEVVTSVAMVRNPRLIHMIGLLVRWIYRHADKLLIQSEGFRKSVKRWGGLDSQIEFVPNWAEDLYRPQTSTAHEHGFRILFAGNLGRAQSLAAVLDAAELTHKAGSGIEWHFMGEGSLREWLEQETAKRNLSASVKLLPRRPEAEMPKIFSQYSVLLASLSRDEVLSLVLPSKIQSSMACAMPILGSADGEMARVIRDSGCGLVSDAEDSKRLAENAIAMSRLTSASLAEMGQRGRSYYEKHFARDLLIHNVCVILQGMTDPRSSK